MSGYEVYLHSTLLEAMPKCGLARRKILDFIYHLREHPNTAGDLTDEDASLRKRQIKAIGDYAVTDWVDEPVKSVMIVDVCAADK